MDQISQVSQKSHISHIGTTKMLDMTILTSLTFITKKRGKVTGRDAKKMVNVKDVDKQRRINSDIPQERIPCFYFSFLSASIRRS